MMATLLLMLAFLLLVGCGDESDGGSSRLACCDSTAAPIYLASKIDDDDGDGNPLDEDFPTINDEDDDISDHAWIRDDHGVYHLFFHTEGLYVDNYIEHYTTRDFRNLDYVGIALRESASGWDSRGLWAPHVVKAGDTYYMFYTGFDEVGASAKQRIGLATSTDLVTWTRYPENLCPGTTGDGCVYECDESWTTWSGPNESFNQQCRDPFVIWDSVKRYWVMLATAKSTNQYGVVTVARSDDLANWTGEGFIDATRRLATGVGAQTTGGQAENPHIMTHGTTHYLLFTDWRDPEDSVSVYNPRTIAQYATSSTLDADTLGSANWTYRGYTPDVAVNAIEVQRIGGDIWLMTQSIANQRSGLWHLRRHLRLKCVVWGDNFKFDTSNVRIPCDDTGHSNSPTAVDAATQPKQPEAGGR